MFRYDAIAPFTSGALVTLQTLVQLLGGVGIFLFAIKLISEALQRMAGDRLRQLIGALTRTPILGLGVGTLVTVLIQSSSATTVMTVSFVDAGLMTLTQAIGVIIGANIGTTVTGQILAIKVKDFAYLFVILGVLLNFCSSSPLRKHAGHALLGFGLLFVGMQTMESSMAFLRSRQDIFLAFSHNPLLGVMAGTLLTLLVQSSSATVGLTIALGMQGLLPLEAAVPIILGDNVGTTITAALAAIGSNRAARQACAAHILFNIIGVCIFLPLLPLCVPLIAKTADSIGHQIANAHTLFNVCNALAFLPFIGPFAKLIRWLIPDAPVKEVPGPQYLDRKLISMSPGMAVDAVRNECVHMGFLAVDLLRQVRKVFFQPDAALEEEARRTDERLDTIRLAVRDYADAIMQRGLSPDSLRVLHVYVKATADMERMGDKSKQLLRCARERQEQPHDFSPQALRELEEMFAQAQGAVIEALDAFLCEDAERAGAVMPLAEVLRSMEMELRGSHMQRMQRQECRPETEFLFVEILSALEHIGFYANSLAKATMAVAGARKAAA